MIKKILEILNTNEIELRVDNRNISVKELRDLETFLQWEFDIMELNFTVKYLNSKYNRDIQMADYVANLMWKKYNVMKEKLSQKVEFITHTHISKFPVKLFSKNPSLKEKNYLKSIA